MALSRFLALSGMALSLLGTWLVAVELVIRFKGYAFEIRTMTFNGQGNPVKTPEFEHWEAKRAKFMWLGLALITLGTFAQMAAVCIVA